MSDNMDYSSIDDAKFFMLCFYFLTFRAYKVLAFEYYFDVMGMSQDVAWEKMQECTRTYVKSTIVPKMKQKEREQASEQSTK